MVVCLQSHYIYNKETHEIFTIFKEVGYVEEKNSLFFISVWELCLT
jgi:hypothetical protein